MYKPTGKGGGVLCGHTNANTFAHATTRQAHWFRFSYTAVPRYFYLVKLIDGVVERKIDLPIKELINSPSVKG